VQDAVRFPHSVRVALTQTRLEHILDSNMFSAFIPRELAIPRVDDPRTTQKGPAGIARHPGHLHGPKIDQIFSYIGFVKRVEHESFRQYLPLLYKELGLFLQVMEDVVYRLNVTIPVEIYREQKRGLENFALTCREHAGGGIAWIKEIWKHQQLYLERLDTLIEALRARGRVFDLSDDPLYGTLLQACRAAMQTSDGEGPDETDCRCVANCWVKAAREREPKNLWSGDRHILRLVKTLYAAPALSAGLPRITLYSNYEPHNYSRWFPADAPAPPLSC
jgi:hypothetical protein